MNGIHDLGGMDNTGPIAVEVDEPVFHDDWERNVCSWMLALLASGYFVTDEIRRITEMMPPAEYLSARYYEKWLWALEQVLIEKGVVTDDELRQGRALKGGGTTRLPPVPAAKMRYAMANPMPVFVDTKIQPRYQPGDQIMTRNFHPHHHTRLPRYARGKCGEIVDLRGVFHLPDANGHGNRDIAEHTYGVRFAARELWGDEASGRDAVYLDMFEGYLRPVAGA